MPTDLNPNLVPSLAFEVKAAVRTVTSTDGAALLDVETGLMFSLNSVGSLIWERLKQGMTPTQIVAAIALEYNRSPQDITGDVEAFIGKLQHHRLIRGRHA